MLLAASSMAQRAVDYILDHQSFPNPATDIEPVDQEAEAV